MDSSSSPTQLPDLLLEISVWIENLNRSEHYKDTIPFSSLDLENLGRYMSGIGVDADLSLRMREKICNNAVWKNRFEPKNYEQVAVMVVSFIQNDLKEVFEVPKPLQPDDGIRTRTFAVEQFFQALGVFLDSDYGITCVLEELGSFCPIFSDRVFEAAESEQEVQCLWAQFEGLVNQVGRFVHSSIFSPHQVVIKRVDILLLERITFLKDSITEFLKRWESSSNSKVVYGDVNSFFIIDSLLQDLVDLLNRSNNPKVSEIKDLIQKLHNSLMVSWSMLKEHLEIQEFREIAVQIKDMAYGAEYVINAFLIGADYVINPFWVRPAPLWYVTLRLTGLIQRIEQLKEDRIQEMKDTTHGVRGQRVVPESLDARQSVLVSRGKNEVDDIMIGFGKEEESILGQLLGDTKHLQIITIVGTPGLGKTTLAKKLHSHPSVRDRFDKRSWCVMSQVYERRSLLVDILEDLGAEVRNDMDEASLALEIHKTLKGRRYFITIDDVWSSEAWDDLRPCFPNDGNGSRILFTSRNMNVAPMGSITNVLPFLSDDECWELLEKKVFNGTTCPHELEVIGKRIVTKCKGLPLAVVVLAGILSSMGAEPNTWTEVEENLEAYFFSEQDKSVMKILELSYQHLSQQLRPCFLYFALFPEDKKIRVKKLKHLWIAEGFIQKKGEKGKECIADEYLEELIRKSLVIVTKKQWDGRAKSCVLHDLLHEMCVRIAEKEMFLKTTDSRHWKDNLKFARLAVQKCDDSLLGFPRSMRSLICSRYSGLSLTGMMLLRVLMKWEEGNGYKNKVTELESTINVRYMDTGELPIIEKILGHENLEYLITFQLKLSSQLFSKMIKLRYIKAYKVRFDGDFEMSQVSGNYLEFLSELWINSQKDVELLKYLPHLRRLKCLYNVWNPTHSCFDVSFLTQLDSFSVCSFGGSSIAGNITITFPLYIRKLTLWWPGLFDLWEEISVLAVLPNLEVLKIGDYTFFGKEWDTKDDEFRKLKFLELHTLPLREWNISSSENFPVLEQLVIYNCQYLEQIPPEIGDIETLQLIDLSGYDRDSPISNSARRIQQEQLDMGNEGLAVITHQRFNQSYQDSDFYFEKPQFYEIAN